MQFYSFPLPVIYDPVVVALRITREFTLISFVLLNVNAGYRVAIKMKMKKKCVNRGGGVSIYRDFFVSHLSNLNEF